MAEWDGQERRVPDVSSIVSYRLDQVEKKIDKLDTNVGDLIKDNISMKAELANVAKSEGKISGAIYGIGSSIVLAVITAVVGLVVK